ncbi:MAG: GAF domain-containing protein, partial [Pseudonocardiaceae bacterium]
MTEATRADRVWGVVSAHAEGLGVAVSVRSLCQAAAARLPVSGVAVSVRGELMVSEVLCATGGLSRELEELQQLTVGEGPSLEVLASGASVLVGELDCAPVQARWPLFAAAAVEAGARALFALPLRVGALRGGVFVLASDRPGRLPGEDLAEAWVFAGFALRLVLDEQAGVNSREGYCMSRPYRSVSRSCSLSGVTRMTGDRLARTFVELADTLVDEFDLVEFLHLLVDRCVELLEVSAAGLLLGDSHDQ